MLDMLIFLAIGLVQDIKCVKMILLIVQYLLVAMTEKTQIKLSTEEEEEAQFHKEVIQPKPKGMIVKYLGIIIAILIIISFAVYKYRVESFNKKIIDGTADLYVGSITTGKILEIFEPQISAKFQSESSTTLKNVCLLTFNFTTLSLPSSKAIRVVDGGEWPKKNGYIEYQEVIGSGCEKESIVMFVSSDLQETAVDKVLSLFEKYDVNLVYSVEGARYQIVAVSSLLFKAIGGINEKGEIVNKDQICSRLWAVQRESIALALIQNSMKKMIKVNKKEIYSDPTVYPFLWVSKLSQSYYKWQKSPNAETDL